MVEHFRDHDDAWDSWDLKLTDPDKGDDSHLSRTIHAFLRQSRPWTKHDSRLGIEKKPKTLNPKKKK
jgi:hypothetical protein